MRLTLWVLTLLLIGSLGLNFYLLVEEITPLKKELSILQEQNKKLYNRLKGTTLSDTSGKQHIRIKEETSLLKGVSALKDTFTLRIQTLKIFKKYKADFSRDGKAILSDFVKSFEPRRIKRVEIVIYQGPYRTLTRNRLKALERYFTKLGVSKGLIKHRADNSLQKWTTVIRVVL